MNLGKFSKSYEEMGQSNKLLLMIVVLLSLALAALSWLLTTRHERIVLVPPYIDKRMEVAWNSANQDYYKAFAVQVATLIGNVTPQTLEFVQNYLSLVMSADIYSRIKPQLDAYGNDDAFKRGTVFSYFTPSAVRFEDKVDKVFVTGLLNTQPMQVSASPNAPKIESKMVTYEFQFKMYNGRPLIVGFDSYEGNKPHTQEWLRQNQKIEEARAERETEQAKK